MHGGRWARVIIYGIVCTVLTRSFAGWLYYSDYLLKGGKYRWLCEESELAVGPRGYATCEAQERALESLFPVYASAENIGSVIAGVLYDVLGPKQTCIVGIIMQVVSMQLQVYSNSAMSDFMTLSAVVGGLAVNIVAFPALVLEHYFPRNRSLAISYVVAVQGLATLVFFTVSKLEPIFYPGVTFSGLWHALSWFVYLPLGAVYFFSLPSRIPKVGDEESQRLVLSENGSVEKKKGTRELLRDIGTDILFTPQCIAMTTCSAVLMMIGTYFQAAMGTLCGDAVGRFVQVATALDALFGLMTGAMCDYLKTPTMGIIQFISYIAIFTACLAGPGFHMYGVGIFWIFTMSYTYIFRMTYIQEFYPPQVMGTLAGLVGVVDGIFVALIGPVQRNLSTQNTVILALILALFTTPVALYLWYDGSKKHVEKRESRELASVELRGSAS